MKLTSLTSLVSSWVPVLSKRIIHYSIEHDELSRKIALDAVDNLKRILDMIEQEIKHEEIVKEAKEAWQKESEAALSEAETTCAEEKAR